MQEISMNILDVAENSVRAGAKLIGLLVDEQPAQDRLTVQITDDGCGMTPEQVKSVADPFFTTRTTRKVGLGIPFFTMAAQLTGGDLTIESTVGKGTAVTAWFVPSHIDCMPLGDINATVFTLVQCNPDIDFVYTRRHGARELIMDTREFRQALGDGIPLNSPGVAQFLRAFLAENTAELLASAEPQNSSETNQ